MVRWVTKGSQIIVVVFLVLQERDLFVIGQSYENQNPRGRTRDNVVIGGAHGNRRTQQPTTSSSSRSGSFAIGSRYSTSSSGIARKVLQDLFQGRGFFEQSHFSETSKHERYACMKVLHLRLTVLSYYNWSCRVNRVFALLG